MFALALQLDDFFLGEQLVAAIGGHLIKFFEPLHRFLYGHPVGKQTAQPAVVHIEHPTASGFFGDGVLGLPLGADKKDSLALRGSVLHKLARVLEHLERFLQVNNVNSVAFPEDVFLHLGVPALGLVPEVDARFEQFLHGDVSQITSLLDCILRGSNCPLGIDSLVRSRQSGRENFGPGYYLPQSACGAASGRQNPQKQRRQKCRLCENFSASRIGSACERLFARTFCALYSGHRGKGSLPL